MDQSRVALISFVIKINVEVRDGEAANPRWYGYITHVESNERAYFTHLCGISDFVLPYLREMGVPTTPWSRLWCRIRDMLP